MYKIFFIIGASGSGKTTAIEALELLNFKNYKMFYFDKSGIPSVNEMQENYGSQEEWQRIKTIEWVKTITETAELNSTIILDIQTRPEFVEEACIDNEISQYKIILFDCSDKERESRLIKRGQKELANQAMLNWAYYLRQKCQEFYIIDNTFLTKDETVLYLLKILTNN